MSYSANHYSRHSLLSMQMGLISSFRARFTVLLLTLGFLVGCGGGKSVVGDAEQHDQYRSLARQVFSETNRLRTAPAAYSSVLKSIESRIRDNIYYPLNTDVGVRMKEGSGVVQEAIAAISRAAPLPQLKWSDALAEVARAHVLDTGPRGLVSHTGSSGQSLAERLEPVMKRERFTTVAENIAYGFDEGQDVVAHLFIDDGVPQRGHRKNLLKKDLNYTGVACGYHQHYRHMCVAIYAYREK